MKNLLFCLAAAATFSQTASAQNAPEKFQKVAFTTSINDLARQKMRLSAELPIGKNATATLSFQRWNVDRTTDDLGLRLFSFGFLSQTNHYQNVGQRFAAGTRFYFVPGKRAFSGFYAEPSVCVGRHRIDVKSETAFLTVFDNKAQIFENAQFTVAGGGLKTGYQFNWSGFVFNPSLAFGATSASAQNSSARDLKTAELMPNDMRVQTSLSLEIGWAF